MIFGGFDVTIITTSYLAHKYIFYEVRPVQTSVKFISATKNKYLPPDSSALPDSPPMKILK